MNWCNRIPEGIDPKGIVELLNARKHNIVAVRGNCDAEVDQMLLEGKKIRLGDLGDFSLLLSSKGAETADKFTAQNITNVKVQWEPGQQFKNLLEDAEFNLVASRSAQAAVIKAIKEGKTNVDLNVPVTPDGGGDGDGTTGGGTQDGGSNAGGSGTTGTEGSGTQGAGGSGTTGDQGTSGGNTGSEGGGDDNVSL